MSSNKLNCVFCCCEIAPEDTEFTFDNEAYRKLIFDKLNLLAEVQCSSSEGFPSCNPCYKEYKDLKKICRQFKEIESQMLTTLKGFQNKVLVSQQKISNTSQTNINFNSKGIANLEEDCFGFRNLLLGKTVTDVHETTFTSTMEGENVPDVPKVPTTNENISSLNIQNPNVSDGYDKGLNKESAQCSTMIDPMIGPIFLHNIVETQMTSEIPADLQDEDGRLAIAMEDNDELEDGEVIDDGNNSEEMQSQPQQVIQVPIRNLNERIEISKTNHPVLAGPSSRNFQKNNNIWATTISATPGKHKCHRCNQCHHIFTTKQGLKSHQKALHNAGVKQIPFQCGKCQRRFNSRNQFYKHQIAHNHSHRSRRRAKKNRKQPGNYQRDNLSSEVEFKIKTEEELMNLDLLGSSQ